jgi:NAD(P)-dependent dehydrogenase (short-subunit alcohol dehydrogenase family)
MPRSAATSGGLASLETGGFLEVDADQRAGAAAGRPGAPVQSSRAARRRVLVNIGSRAGSLAEGTIDDEDGDYAYRCSKAALNMATVKLAQDFRGRRHRGHRAASRLGEARTWAGRKRRSRLTDSAAGPEGV